MKTGFTTLLLLVIASSLLQSGCAHRTCCTGTGPADAKPASAANAKPAAAADKTAVPPPESRPALTNMEDRVGYAIGMSIGNNLKRTKFDVNLDALMEGVRDVLADREPRMTEQQAQGAIMDYQKQKQHELVLQNLKEGEAFLAENKNKEGVKVQPVTLPDGTTAELQYKVITEGTGEIPKSNDTVSVNFRGTLINGTEFDSTAKRGGRPYKFVVDQANITRGLSEALQIMKVGSKWQLVIPASLAYNERPLRAIPPGSTLIYELELLSIDRPKPLTSDIIRVPSAEEMKAGAKVEVIKAEDAERMAAAQTNSQVNPATGDKK
jgi:FKBP-type peptidyl-prolyl cis-trans isomerase FklB